jgi:S-methylmethionine-dependent homocysteine/selenocysteine methylase
MEHLRDRIAAGGVVVLDGGTGTEIEGRGVPMDGAAWSALANVTHPDVVRSVHEDYIRAGAQVVIANTFASGPGALAAAGVEDRFDEVNHAAVRLAQEARELAAEQPVAVAGSLSLMAFRGLTDEREADPRRILEAYRAQAQALASAGVDLLVLEMMSAALHAGPALEAAAETGLPVWLGLSTVRPGADGRPVTVHGADLDQLLRELLSGPAQVDAVLVMHTELAHTAAALDVVAARFDGPTGAYPDSGDWAPPNWTFSDLSPDAFAAQVGAWAGRGVQLLGGCCGIRPDHIRALHAAVAQ